MMAEGTFYLKIKLDFYNYYTLYIRILLYNLRPEGKDYVLPNTNLINIICRIYYNICIDNIKKKKIIKLSIQIKYLCAYHIPRR